jgi:D-alanyl-D-alanine carboxypeptidase
VDDRDVTATRVDGSTVVHTETPMPVDGTYPIQHITKTFVAAAALQLVDEGRLALDEPVAPWLPELPGADAITPRMLLAYTSGLAPWWDDVDYIPTLLDDPTRSFTPAEVLGEYLQDPSVAAPGGEPVFGGVGYIALGVLIERVLGEDLATVIEQRFTRPLSLDETSLGDGSAWPSRHGWLSRPGADDPNRTFDMLDQPSQAVITTLWAERGMTSSSTDLLDWGDALFGGDVLGPNTTATMLTMNPAVVPPVPGRYFALGATGYCLTDGCGTDEVELVGAPGSTSFGWSVQLVHHPSSGTTIVVQANVAIADPADLLAVPVEVIRQLQL